MDALISAATRRAFEDSYVKFGVLRDISHDFDDAGIDCTELPKPDQLVGQRRELLHRYYASVDWSSPADAQRVLHAYASHLQRLRERPVVDEAQPVGDEVDRLLRHLKRDMARCSAPTVFDVIMHELDPAFSSRTRAIEDTASAVETSFHQAFEHLSQALEHLRAPQTSRSRKDGLRDCLSAMESLLKAATGTDDIRDATTALRADSRWGIDAIVKDGLSIWSRIHELYPDVRHGQASGSDLSDHECLYWVDRITSFVRYIERRADEILAK
jgi:hypothetical protein